MEPSTISSSLYKLMVGGAYAHFKLRYVYSMNASFPSKEEWQYFLSSKESFLVTLWSNCLIWPRRPRGGGRLGGVGGKMNGKWLVNPYGQGLCHCGSLFCRLRSLSDHHSTPGSNTQVVPASQRSPVPSTDFLTSPKSGLLGMTTTLSGTTLTVVMGNRSNPCLFDHSLGYFTNALIEKKKIIIYFGCTGF